MDTQLGIYVNGVWDTVRNTSALYSIDYNIKSDGYLTTVINEGYLESLNESSIITNGIYSTIRNSGTIEAAKIGIACYGDNSDVVNEGSIHAKQTGIFLAGESSSIYVGAVVNADKTGIVMAADKESLLLGDIVLGHNVAVHTLGDHNSIVNNSRLMADRTVEGGGIGVLVSGNDTSIVNNGILSGNDWQHGTAIVIRGSGDARIINHGLIYGDVSIKAGSGAQYVENDGQINSAVYLGNGDDTYVQHFEMSASNIDIFFGGGNDVYHGEENLGFQLKLHGGGGNDTYYVGGPESVLEDKGKGNDTVISSFGGQLASNIENLIITGSDSVYAAGNELGNHITGNRGDNTLTGGDGRDTFVFRTNGGSDTITDFEVGKDWLDLTDVKHIGGWESLKYHSYEWNGSTVIDLSNTDAHLKITLTSVHISDVNASALVL